MVEHSIGVRSRNSNTDRNGTSSYQPDHTPIRVIQIGIRQTVTFPLIGAKLKVTQPCKQTELLNSGLVLMHRYATDIPEQGSTEDRNNPGADWFLYTMGHEGEDRTILYFMPQALPLCHGHMRLFCLISLNKRNVVRLLCAGRRRRIHVHCVSHSTIHKWFLWIYVSLFA